MRPMPENYYDGHLQSIIYGLDLAGRGFLARRQGKKEHKARTITPGHQKKHVTTRVLFGYFFLPNLSTTANENSGRNQENGESSYLIVVVYPRICLFPFRSIVKRVQVCATTLFVVSLILHKVEMFRPVLSSSSPNLVVKKKTGGKNCFFPGETSRTESTETRRSLQIQRSSPVKSIECTIH
jgi:hypothetical protein